MGYAELLFRRDLGKRPYRLRCRFQIDARPKAEWLEKAKIAAAEAFVRDLRKQGFEYMDVHGIRMTGPYAVAVIPRLPKRSQQEPWHVNAREMLPAALAGYRPPAPSGMGPVGTIPLLGHSEKWEYELAAVFIHETMLMVDIQDEIGGKDDPGSGERSPSADSARD